METSSIPIQSTTVIGPPANCNQKRGTINPATQPPNPQQNLHYPDSYYFSLLGILIYIVKGQLFISSGNT